MPKKQQARKFLRNRRNGWEFYKDTDHEHYRKTLPNGEVIYTKLSHGNGEIPPSVWKMMLKQMRITQEEFNAGL